MNGNVMIVDDDLHVRNSIKSMFANEGYSVRKAKSGKDAIRYQKMNSSDVILLDMSMPTLDGVETLRAIRKFDSNVQFIVVSGFLSDYEQEISDSVYDTFSKPVRREKNRLLQSVRGAIKYSNRIKEEQVNPITEKVYALFEKWVSSFPDKNEKNIHYGEFIYSLADIVGEVKTGSELGTTFIDAFIEDYEDYLDSQGFDSE